MKSQRLTYLISVFVFVGSTTSIFSQDSTNVKCVYGSNLTIEAGGAGLYGSINYEHLISYKSNKKMLCRVGLSYLPYSTYRNKDAFMGVTPFGIYYLIGNNNHLELGLNNTFGFMIGANGFEYALNPSIGYRSQKFLSRSITFSIAFSPLIGIAGNYILNNREFVPWAKIGIGYNFNRRDLKTHPVSDSLDTTKGKRVFIELGTHFLTAKQNSISKNRNNGNGGSDVLYIGFPIDTSIIYKNVLVTNWRFFPTISAGIYFKNHEFKTEFAYVNYKSSYSSGGGDYGRYAYFKSEEYYYLIGDSYRWLMNKKNKPNPNTRFYTGVNILFQHKGRTFYDYHYNGIGGCPCSSEDLNSDFVSNHISLIPDAGIKWGYNQKIYLRFGLRFNAVSYAYGKFSWHYTTITDTYPQITTYSGNSGSFSKLLTAGESGHFMLVDNFYLKVGFSF